jgi:hypothetical protein
MVLRLLPFLIAGCALAQYPAPHAGWKLVAGGENLISGGYWNSTGQGTPSPAVVNGALTVGTTSGYIGNYDAMAPRLMTTGDWGVIATFNVGAGVDGLATVFGSLSTGSLYWQGQTEVEFGVDNNGNYVFAYWDGTSANPVLYDVLKTFSGLRRER